MSRGDLLRTRCRGQESVCRWRGGRGRVGRGCRRGRRARGRRRRRGRGGGCSRRDRGPLGGSRLGWRLRASARRARGEDEREHDQQEREGAKSHRLMALLLDVHELDLEVQRRVGGDDLPHAVVAVRERRRDDELALPTDFHPDDPLVPTSNHLPLAEGEDERLPALSRAVELLPVEERPHVVDAHGVARLGHGPLSDDQVRRHELRVRIGRRGGGSGSRRARLGSGRLGRRRGGSRRVGGDGDWLGRGREAVAGGQSADGACGARGAGEKSQGGEGGDRAEGRHVRGRER